MNPLSALVIELLANPGPAVLILLDKDRTEVFQRRPKRVLRAGIEGVRACFEAANLVDAEVRAFGDTLDGYLRDGASRASERWAEMWLCTHTPSFPQSGREVTDRCRDVCGPASLRVTMSAMPELSPLPQRHGLDAARVRTPDRVPGEGAPWETMRDWLWEKVGTHVDVDAFLAAGRFVWRDGSALTPSDAYRPHTFVWFYRDLRHEPEVPGHIPVLYRDERLIVVDKPPFLATIPRGQHVMQSVTTKLRAALALPELSPVHRLDRITSGVLLLTTERRWRGAYQTMFQRREVSRMYRALGRTVADLAPSVTVENHLHKISGEQRVRVLPDRPPNARSIIEVDRHLGYVEPFGDVTEYRLYPQTGKTHQLRQHLCSIGSPIVGDPLYPEVVPVSIDDFSSPLQLLAARMRFIDPVDGSEREYHSTRSLPLGEAETAEPVSSS